MKARTVSQRPWAALGGRLALALACAWPLALLERAWGVGASAVSQAWVVPAGLAGAAASWVGLRRLAPGPSGDRLVVSPASLEYRPAQGPAQVLEAGSVGLVDVSGEPVGGRYAVIVHGQDSAVLAVWQPRWAGWTVRRVVRVLRAAGYPAHPHGAIYDGRFQAQTPGLPPRTVG